MMVLKFMNPHLLGIFLLNLRTDFNSKAAKCYREAAEFCLSGRLWVLKEQVGLLWRLTFFQLTLLLNSMRCK